MDTQEGINSKKLGSPTDNDSKHLPYAVIVCCFKNILPQCVLSESNPSYGPEPLSTSLLPSKMTPLNTSKLLRLYLHTQTVTNTGHKPLILFSLRRRHGLLLLQVLDHSVLFHHHLKHMMQGDTGRCQNKPHV